MRSNFRLSRTSRKNRVLYCSQLAPLQYCRPSKTELSISFARGCLVLLHFLVVAKYHARNSGVLDAADARMFLGILENVSPIGIRLSFGLDVWLLARFVLLELVPPPPRMNRRELRINQSEVALNRIAVTRVEERNHKKHKAQYDERNEALGSLLPPYIQRQNLAHAEAVKS
jgi:hypothetical protein